jgi:hypothetical protein
MGNLDQFESLFRSSLKEQYVYKEIEFSKVLIITDLDALEAEDFGKKVRSFLSVLEEEVSEWRTVQGNEYNNAVELFDFVQKEKPSLICTYRNLKSKA